MSEELLQVIRSIEKRLDSIESRLPKVEEFTWQPKEELESDLVTEEEIGQIITDEGLSSSSEVVSHKEPVKGMSITNLLKNEVLYEM
jgi:hypothetical protein